MPLCLAACKRGAEVLELTGLTMGTRYNIVAVDHERALSETDLQRAVEAGLAEVNVQMSNWDASSEISRFNAAATTETISVSPELSRVMTAAQEVHAASAGQFDVTVGPLIDLWGFGAAGAGSRMPGEAEIAVALESAGQEKTLRIGDGVLQKIRPEAEVYLSAIGKGYGVDRIARVLEAHGLRDYMVEIGGDLYTSGRNPDGMPWRIGIETPDARGRGLQDVAAVSGAGMATSGDYRNYFEDDGVRYSHIIDPTTGRPITHRTVSATVVTENAMFADAWATAMLLLGRERGMDIAEERDMAVLFIDRDEGAEAPFATTPSTRFAELHA